MSKRTASERVVLPASSAAGAHTSSSKTISQESQQIAILSHILKIEADARLAKNCRELFDVAANEVRSISRARQAFVLERRRRGAPIIVRAASGISTVVRESPLIQSIESIAVNLERVDGLHDQREFVLPAYCNPEDPTISVYPFTNMLWVPFSKTATTAPAGLLLTRETPWLEADKKIAMRLADAIGHASCLLQTTPRAIRPTVAKGKRAALAVAVLGLIGAIPVPITALAPVEVVPKNPFIVSMPLDGMVQSVLVTPNDRVKAGQPLVRLQDTAARNKFGIADREVAVAEARVERSNSLAYSDPKGRHELGIARAELALRSAERDYARDMLAQHEILALGEGVVVFSDRKDLEGRPFGAGERLMQIANPGTIELRVDLAAADSIVLNPGAKVKAFLDSDPLNSIDAVVSRIDYQARLSDAGVASYKVMADVQGGNGHPQRFGIRGTAQVFGPSACIALQLFRRPVSAIRQWIGL